MKEVKKNQDLSLKRAKRFIKILGAISLVLAPFLSFIGWGIAHESLASFLNFNFTYIPTDATANLTASSDPLLLFRYYLLPHYFIYASMPVYIALGLTLMYATYRKAPWHSFIGSIFSIIGGVYFIGVLGAFLSIPMGTVDMTNILKVSFALCMLVFVGNILLGISLYKANVSPKWSALLFITGNALILVFPGIENWMSLGSLMMLISMITISDKIIKQHLHQ
jgi:hypothetical protein